MRTVTGLSYETLALCVGTIYIVKEEELAVNFRTKEFLNGSASLVVATSHTLSMAWMGDGDE